MSKQPHARQARAHLAGGNPREAETAIAKLIEEVSGKSIRRVRINDDLFSLNSVSGFAAFASGEELFFKFHQEDGEEHSVQEYYNVTLLKKAGYPIDEPVYVSREPGRQILLYHRRSDARFADVCLAIELGEDASETDRVLGVQREIDRSVGQWLLDSLHRPGLEDIRREPIHQLFHSRLVDPAAPGEPGGRCASFYIGKTFAFPGATVSWDRLARLQWRINGVSYERTLGGLFDESRVALAPERLAGHGAVVAHGDAHNANIWYERAARRNALPRLVFFDPAFAGPHVPALLAEGKPTFHNIFAHPLWLYAPDRAARQFNASVEVKGDTIEVEHDCALSPIRIEFLESKFDAVWRPLVHELDRRQWLPRNWRRIIRLALFCCPTLVMNLRAGGSGGHNPTSSAIGLATAVAMGCDPCGGQSDVLSRALDGITP